MDAKVYVQIFQTKLHRLRKKWIVRIINISTDRLQHHKKKLIMQPTPHQWDNFGTLKIISLN